MAALTGFSMLGGGFAVIGAIFALSRGLPMIAGFAALAGLLGIGISFLASAKLRETSAHQS